MKLTSGLATDTGSIDQKEGTWRAGRNALVSGQYGAITNEPGFDIIMSLPGINIGNVVLDSNLVSFFQVNGDNSEIYIGNLTTKTTILVTSNTVFGFNVNFPISGEYYRNSKGEIIISFTDNNMPPRIINTVTNYGTAIDKLTRVYLKYTIPTLTSSQITDSGGSLLTGSHYISTAYVDIDNAQTPYTPALGPFYITDNLRSEIGPNYDGAVAGQLTSKALTLNFTDIDTDYTYLVVTLISKIDGIITAKQIKKVAISGTTLSTTILGSENEGVVALEDIIIGPDVFSKVESMTQLQNQLLFANLSKEDKIAFQLSALDITISYEQTTASIASTDDTNPKLNPQRGFMHNEVYALFIHLVKNDGTITQGFHIPGRPVAVYNNSNFPEFNGIYENQVVTVASGDHITRAVGIGGSSSKIFQFFETSDNSGASTNMQYWENEETYPISDEFGVLSGQPVRHHKFPTLAHIKDIYYPSNGEFGKSILSRLNIKVSNVTLPEGYIGYFISAAKRNVNNSTIIAQDLMLYSGRRDRFATTDQLYWTSAGNWTVSTDSQSNIQDYTYLRLHSFDLLIDRPAAAPNYVESEFIIYNRDITVPYNFSSKTGGSILQSGGTYTNPSSGAPAIPSLNGVTLSDDNRRQDLLLIDETKGNVIVSSSTYKRRFSGCSDFKYLPNNVQSGLGALMNLQAEECATVKLANGEIYGLNGLVLHGYSTNSGRRIPQFTDGVGTGGVSEELSYLYNLKQYRQDVYPNMFSQDLFIIHPNMISPTNSSTESSVLGGDIIVSDMSFFTYGPQGPGDSNQLRGVRVARRHIVETVNFASFRYISSEESSAFYPEIDPFPYMMFDKTAEVNKFAYNKDYSSVNDINSLTVNDPIQNLQINTLFPYRIIRSRIGQVEENGINDWRTFPVSDYYEMPKNRGPIINIKGYGDNLIINQRYALFRTRNKIELATNVGKVVAGTGDIFEITPEEMAPTEEGYAGCQHKFSCLLTKGGYFFIDAEQGKIFLLGNSLTEISVRDNSIYFFDNLSGVNDNPFTDTGYTIGWDSEYNRILLSKTNDFTKSFSLDLEGKWAFDHDYHPDSMFHTRDGLFSIKDNTVFRHNSLTKVAQYYDDTIYPTSIVPVFNSDTKSRAEGYTQDYGVGQKYFYNIKWVAEVRNKLGAIQTKETLTNLFIYNSFQATNLIQLSNYQSIDFQYNLRKTGGVWHFNRFRDLVLDSSKPIQLNNLPITGNINVNKPIQYKRRFIDHYLLVNFIYDNQPVDGEQRNLYLYEVDVDFKPIKR